MPPTERPNIVLFNPDHYRGEAMGHAGNPCVYTPNLDRLVQQDAVSFTRAFCQNPVCVPSRCSFMSGWYPHVAGHRTMAYLMHPGEPVVLRTLKDAGYHVWWGGKNDLVAGQLGTDAYCDVRFTAPPGSGGDSVHAELPDGWRGDPGGDSYYSFFAGKLQVPPGRVLFPDHDLAVVEAAIEHLDHLPEDRPFCIFLALLNPHPPIAVEEPFFSMIDRKRVPPRIKPPENYEGKASMLAAIARLSRMERWEEHRWNELRAVHYGMCSRVDHLFGMLLDKLAKRGVLENTLVVFFGDHGMYAGDYGLVDINQNTFEDVLTRVPLVIKPPTGYPLVPGTTDTLVELLDLSATVLDFAGIQPDWPNFGCSLRPLLDRRTLLDRGTDTHRDAVFCEGGRLPGEDQAMEKEYLPGHRDPEDLYYPRLSIQSAEGTEHTKAIMCRTSEWKYVYRLCEGDELYDLRQDPQEVRNLAASPSHAAVLATMRDRVLRFMVETADVVPFTVDQRW